MTVALARFAAFIRTLTSLNRFVPQLRRLSDATSELMAASQRADARADLSSCASLPTQIDIPRVVPEGRAGAGEALVIEPGICVAILAGDWAALGSFVAMRTPNDRALWPGCSSLLTPHALDGGSGSDSSPDRVGRTSTAELAAWIEQALREAPAGNLLAIDAGCLRPNARAAIGSVLANRSGQSVAVLVPDAATDLSWASAVLAWNGTELAYWARPSDLAIDPDLLPDVLTSDPESDDALDDEDEP